MAGPKREYSPYQQKVIRDFYRNQDSIREQALAALVSDLWLATTEKKRDALWKKAESLLSGLGAPASAVAAVVGKRDVKGLAELANRGFAPEKGGG
jgi:hypothetical protein